MKVLFTGGGTGGHFYPIIAVAEELNQIIKDEKLVPAEMYFMSPKPYNEGLLYENNIVFKKSPAGKYRRYFSILNFLDFFKTIVGVIKAFWQVYLIYPDVVFSKGGYASFPTVFASRILRIPVIIHESDTVPGKVNKWCGKFAHKIAVSYPEAVKHFPEKKTAFTGNPIRKNITILISKDSIEHFKLEKNLPVIFIIGGSLGSRSINEAVLEALPRLIEKYQIIHQTGKNNFEEVKQTVDVILMDNPLRKRFKQFGYMDDLNLRSAAGISNLIISRAGSSIFEIASWGIPSVIIPIPYSNEDHQIKNAYAYARTGSALVIEEGNLTGNILFAEIERIMSDKELYQKMKESTKSFVKSDAAKLIAEEIIKLGIKHDLENE